MALTNPKTTKQVTLVYTTRRKLRKRITLTPKTNNDVKYSY